MRPASPTIINMRLVLVTIFLGACWQISLAQQTTGEINAKAAGRIYGIVMDSLSHRPVEFANVALIDPSTNKPVNGTVCDENGRFSITKVALGNYWVSISFIGFETRQIAASVPTAKSDVNLGAVDIRPITKLLKEVIVQGQRTLVEEKVDRTVYNAEFDATSKGGDATDVLKRVPLLSVDVDGNVSLRGSTSVKVLINNNHPP